MQTTCIMRTNIYKQKILDVLSKSHLISISDIHKQIPEANHSTIFRNVEGLCDDNLIKKIVLAKGIVMYESVSGHSHDHFVCDDCGKVETLHLSRDFKLTGKAIVKDILLKGTCSDCNC